MRLKHVYPEKIPKEMLEKNYIDDIILYSLGAHGPLQKAEFDKINKTTFYKYLNSLIEKGFLFPPKRKRKIAIYEITPSGQAELIRRLEKYNLDFYELIALEKKKILAQVSQLSSFFEKYNISDDETKIDFLYLYNNLIRDKSLSIFSEEQFNILILYIVLNDVKLFKKVENVLTIEEFIEKIEVGIILTKTDIQMFIQEVVDKNRYGINMFKIPLMKEDTFLFFGENSEIGIIFETIIKKHLRNLNYLKSLNNSRIYASDLGDIMKPIMYDLTKKYKIFNKEIEKEIFHLVEDFITDLQIELHEKQFVEFGKIGEYFSIYSPWVGLTHPFKPLSEEDELELKDIRTTFQRIREKEPKNKLLSKTSDYLYDNKLEEALIEVNKCLEIDSKDSETLELKSRILFDKGNFKRALEIFEDAQQFKTDVESIIDRFYIYFFRAELFLALKQHDKALNIIEKGLPSLFKDDKEFDEFVKEDYFSYQVFKLEATIYLEQGKFNEALEVINKDIEYMEIYIGMIEDEMIADSFILKSKILKKLGKHEEAYKILNIAVSFKPNDPELLFEIATLGIIFYPVKGFFAQTKALKLSPNNEKYLKFYKRSLVIPHIILYIADSQLQITKNISNIFNNQRSGMTPIELNEKLQDFGELKFLDISLREVSTTYVDIVIDIAIDRKAIEMIDDSYIQNSDVMKEHLKELEISHFKTLLDCYYINLLYIYRSNDWKEFQKENLISKLVTEISGKKLELIESTLINDTSTKEFLMATKENLMSFDRDNLEELVYSLVNNLIGKKFLNVTKENLITIDLDKFEAQFDELRNEIAQEEFTKFVSYL